jgi:hypothetical protein
MKRASMLLAIVSLYSILFFFFTKAHGNHQNQLQYSLVKIHVTDKDDIYSILKSGISLDNSKTETDGILVTLNSIEIKILNNLGYSYSVVVNDVIDHYEKNIRLPDDQLPALQKKMKQQYGIQGFEFGSMGGYYTFNEILAELDSMRMLYPHLITVKQSIGTSIEGRDIWMVKISDNPDITEYEPEVFFNSLTHAREPQSMASLLYFMYYLLENYGINPLVTYLIENREIYIVPVINPDSYTYNEQTNPNGGGMWRKNKRDNNGNGIFEELYDGVDLNRNFGYMWGYDDIGSSPIPSSWNYRGTGPFSELETQVIRDFCVNQNFQMASIIHSAWEVIFYPFGYDLNVVPPEPDLSIFIKQGTEMIQYNDYILQNPSNNYPLNGDAGDWMYGEQTVKNKIFSYVYEVGPTLINGVWQFWPGQDKIYPIAQGDVYPHLVMALGEGVIESDTSLFIQSTSLNSNSLTAGVDTLRIHTEVLNLDSSALSMNAIVETYDLSFKEIISLNEILPKEKTKGVFNYSGYWPVPMYLEDNFNVTIVGTSIPSNNQIIKFAGRFTSIGPITFVDYTITSPDTIPNHGDYLNFVLMLHNNGQLATAEKISATLSALDSCAIVNRTRNFGDISAGSSVSSASHYPIRFINNCPDSIYVPFKLDIASNGYVFWTDTFSIFVHKDPSPIETAENNLPLTFDLKQNYPNPFNPRTTIEFSIPKTEFVTLKIYNLLGQEVAALVSEKLTPGNYKYTWDASGFASGLYYYQIKSSEFQKVKKMIVIK